MAIGAVSGMTGAGCIVRFGRKRDTRRPKERLGNIKIGDFGFCLRSGAWQCSSSRVCSLRFGEIEDGNGQHRRWRVEKEWLGLQWAHQSRSDWTIWGGAGVQFVWANSAPPPETDKKIGGQKDGGFCVFGVNLGRCFALRRRDGSAPRGTWVFRSSFWRNRGWRASKADWWRWSGLACDGLTSRGTTGLLGACSLRFADFFDSTLVPTENGTRKTENVPACSLRFGDLLRFSPAPHGKRNSENRKRPGFVQFVLAKTLSFNGTDGRTGRRWLVLGIRRRGLVSCVFESGVSLPSLLAPFSILAISGPLSIL